MKLLYTCTCLLIFLWVFTAHSLIQFDTKGCFILSEDSAGLGSLERKTFKVESYINSTKTFENGISLFLRHRVDGSTIYQAMREQIVPIEHYLSLGIDYESDNDFSTSLDIDNDFFGNSITVRPYFFKSPDSTMTPQLLSSAQGCIALTPDRFYLLLNTTYSHLNYNLTYITIEPNSFAVDSIDTIIEGAIESDLWSSVDVGFHFTDQFAINSYILWKDDFGVSNTFNYVDISLGFQGDHRYRKKGRTLFFQWNLYEHYRMSEAVYLKGDPDGLATVIYANPVFKMRKKYYIKGVLKLDLSDKMQKQWYELSLRKTFKNNSAFEIVGWAVLGSVFPRMNTTITGVLTLGERVALLPSIQGYMRQHYDDGKFKFYRASGSLETTIRMTKKTELYLGYSHTQYVHSNFMDIKPFTNRSNMYLGCRKW